MWSPGGRAAAAATTIFVAVQCCECRTMQVKQRKKSSNKWTCVICNQKQSVVKVFAQGPLAKDLRKFVQSFNMSRNQPQPFDHHPSSTSFEDDDDGNGVGGGQEENHSHRKRRTDWTQYLDHPDPPRPHPQEQPHSGGDLEPKIVTELPAEAKQKQQQLKRPKLRDYGKQGGSQNHQPFNPLFPYRNRNSPNDEEEEEEDVMLISQDKNKLMRQQAATGSLSRRDITIGNGEEPTRDYKPAATLQGNSKWKHYLTQDDDDDHHHDNKGIQCPRNSATHHLMNKWGNLVFETESNYQTVQEDVHPDFM